MTMKRPQAERARVTTLQRRPIRTRLSGAIAWTVVAGALSMVMAVATAPPAPAGTITPLTEPMIAPQAEAASPLLFGAHAGPRHGQSPQQEVLQLESTIGRKLASVRVYDRWDTQFPSSYEEWLRDTGHIVVLSVKALRINNTRIKWIDIANAVPGSRLHDEMVGWANSVRDFGGPVWFTFNHEPEAKTNDASGPAQDFIAAWRKVITVFRQQGVANAKYVWIATSYSFSRTDNRRAALWYPGDAYVDAIGADPYNWYNCRPGVNNPWWSLQQIIEPLRLFGLAHPDEELILTEFGSYEDPAIAGRKAQWFNGAQQLFKQPGWEQFTAIMYYNSVGSGDPNCPWWIDTSQGSLDAFRTLANDPFYGASPSNDMNAPSVPDKPTGASSMPNSINLTWGASTDDVAQSLEYRIYRDGGSDPVGFVSSSSTTTVAFTDAGLVPGSSHTYEVTASDGTNTSALSPVSDPISVMPGAPPIFSDDFTTGNFSSWTSATRLTIDTGQGAPSAPSARAQVSSLSAFAYRDLATTYASACLSANVIATSFGGNAVDLFRLRTASNGPIARVFANANGVLSIRSDASGAQRSSATVIGSGWHNVELCGSVGSAGSWDLYRDGVKIVNGWLANTGTSPIGRIQIGDTAAKTFTMRWDHVVLDSTQG
jgi:hypothetical protein